MLTQNEGRYVVVGEGAGQKMATGLAHEELNRLTVSEIQALLASAKLAHKK
jgi:hypothetical protein